MEKKIKGVVIDRLVGIDSLSFKIRISEVTTYIIKNSHRVPTDSDTVGVECYIGNLEMKSDGCINEESVLLWIYPDKECVIVYNE